MYAWRQCVFCPPPYGEDSAITKHIDTLDIWVCVESRIAWKVVNSRKTSLCVESCKPI